MLSSESKVQKFTAFKKKKNKRNQDVHNMVITDTNFVLPRTGSFL